MIPEQDIIRCIGRLYPVAVLCLGSLTEGRNAVTEAIAAAMRKSPDDWQTQALSHLIRICRTRAPERITQHAFPDDPELNRLLPILKLPAGSRRTVALLLSDFSQKDAAAASGATVEEYAKKTEKALRQLTFVQNGEEPQTDLLRKAAAHIPCSEADTEIILSAVCGAAAETDAEAAQPAAPVREITVSAQKQKSNAKTVAVPLWGIALGAALILLLLVAVILQMNRTPRPPVPIQNEIHSEEIKELFSAKYLSIAAVQKIAANDVGYAPEKLCFLSTKLKTNETPAQYVLLFAVGRSEQFEYTLHAESGEILTKKKAKAEEIPDTAGWLPAEKIRQTALERTGLHDVLFLKEKCGADGDSGYYKFDLLDAAEKIYHIQVDAKTGMLMKYSAEELAEDEPENIIPPEKAKQLALARVSVPDASQLIFTKVKQDSGVYLIEFSLDDGTQYMIELNAVTGSINTVDVHPVSADISQAIGLLKARDIALNMAQISDLNAVSFSKAKIDRSNGSYVYELKFETDAYEFEVTINTQDGTLLDYRALGK